MKNLMLIFAIQCAWATVASGQSQFLYDQQSVTEKTGGGVPVKLQDYQIVGQSFTPTMSSVGFIRLSVGDFQLGGSGATVYVNLRSGSIAGPIMSSTDPVILADGFVGRVDFIFPTPVEVTPGTTYYFQPVATGDLWAVQLYDYNYAGGESYVSGKPNPGQDLWFREGVVIPEPSVLILGLVGFGFLCAASFRKKHR